MSSLISKTTSNEKLNINRYIFDNYSGYNNIKPMDKTLEQIMSYVSVIATSPNDTQITKTELEIVA